MLDKLAANWWILRTWDHGTCFETEGACEGKNLLAFGAEAIDGNGAIWLVIGNIAYSLLVVSGIITMFVMVIGGIMYITANGSPDKVAKGTSTITGGLVGAIISISAATIVGFVTDLVAADPNNRVGGTVSNIMGALYFAAGSLAVVMIIYSGLMYMTASGDEAKLKKAKSSLVWALAGLAVAIGAWVITQFVVGGVTEGL